MCILVFLRNRTITTFRDSSLVYSVCATFWYTEYWNFKILICACLNTKAKMPRRHFCWLVVQTINDWISKRNIVHIFINWWWRSDDAETLWFFFNKYINFNMSKLLCLHFLILFCYADKFCWVRKKRFNDVRSMQYGVFLGKKLHSNGSEFFSNNLREIWTTFK